MATTDSKSSWWLKILQKKKETQQKRKIPSLEKLHFCMPCALLISQLLSRVQLFETPWTVSRQAPLSMRILQARILEWVAMPSSRWMFPTQESNPESPKILKWVAIPYPGDLPDPGIEPGSPALQVDFFTSWGTREAPLYVPELFKYPKNCRPQAELTISNVIT